MTFAISDLFGVSDPANEIVNLNGTVKFGAAGRRYGTKDAFKATEDISDGISDHNRKLGTAISGHLGVETDAVNPTQD